MCLKKETYLVGITSFYFKIQVRNRKIAAVMEVAAEKNESRPLPTCILRAMGLSEFSSITDKEASGIHEAESSSISSRYNFRKRREAFEKQKNDNDLKMSLCEKSLCVCLTSPCFADQAVSYSIWYGPLASLLVNSSGVAEEFSPIYTWASKDECVDRSIITLGTRVYFLGGYRSYRSPGCWSKELFYLDLSDGTEGWSGYSPGFLLPLKAMESEKPKPIVVAIGAKIYVLAGYPLIDASKPSFEVYDPRTDTWSSLRSPPLFIESNEYFCGGTTHQLSYVVIGNKLCISSRHASFAYDTVGGRWKPCKLFEGFNGDVGRGERGVEVSSNEFQDVLHVARKIPCGPPFSFRQGAILYDDDVLLCAATAPLLAVAYQMDRGKVVKQQGFLLADAPDISCDFLVNLGGGYFCCICQNKYKDEANLSLVTFKISKLGGVLKRNPWSHFLEGEVVSISNQRMRLEHRYELLYAFPY